MTVSWLLKLTDLETWNLMNNFVLFVIQMILKMNSTLHEHDYYNWVLRTTDLIIYIFLPNDEG